MTWGSYPDDIAVPRANLPGLAQTFGRPRHSVRPIADAIRVTRADFETLTALSVPYKPNLIRAKGNLARVYHKSQPSNNTASAARENTVRESGALPAPILVR